MSGFQTELFNMFKLERLLKMNSILAINLTRGSLCLLLGISILSFHNNSEAREPDNSYRNVQLNLSVIEYYEAGECVRVGVSCDQEEADDLGGSYCVHRLQNGVEEYICLYNVQEVTGNSFNFHVSGDPTSALFECDGNCNSPPPGGSSGPIIVKEILPNKVILSDDLDGDEYQDQLDNCPAVCNGVLKENGKPYCSDNIGSYEGEEQQDSDGDGIGDACDNCPNTPSQNLADIDGDGSGDVCDNNDDDDNRDDDNDNCPLVKNNNQSDSDGDGVGDACDPDIDGDGIINELDNCPYTDNPLQENYDNHIDNVGDLCDEDYDNDGYSDIEDNSRTFESSSQQDDDNDGFGNVADNCPRVFNPNQLDSNQNGIGDECDE